MICSAIQPDGLGTLCSTICTSSLPQLVFRTIIELIDGHQITGNMTGENDANSTVAASTTAVLKPDS
jgi:hypothetical protein